MKGFTVGSLFFSGSVFSLMLPVQWVRSPPWLHCVNDTASP